MFEVHSEIFMNEIMKYQMNLLGAGSGWGRDDTRLAMS